MTARSDEYDCTDTGRGLRRGEGGFEGEFGGKGNLGGFEVEEMIFEGDGSLRGEWKKVGDYRIDLRAVVAENGPARVKN